MRLDSIHIILKEYIEEQKELHHIDRDINSWQFDKLLELADQLNDIIHYEPTDQEMMSSFGTKWHDAL